MCRTYTEIKAQEKFWCCYWSKLGLGQGEAFRLDEETLPNSCLVNLIDVTLACEDANSKLDEVVTVADEDRVGNSLLQI